MMTYLAAFILIIGSISANTLKISSSHPGFYDDFSNHIEFPTNSCQCEDSLLCLPLEEAKRRNSSAHFVIKYIEKQAKTEIFAFVVKCDVSVWSKFDWDKITTIGLAGSYDPQLVCYAHKKGVRAVKLANIPTNQLPDPEARSQWVKLQSSDVAIKFLDGINIDYESPILPHTPEQAGLTALVKETSEVFHQAMPGSQVSFDVAWSAAGIDDRYYDYKAIANYSDLIFIMAYDEQSQIWDEPCSARPNSGIYKTAKGIQTYLNLNIPPQKMVLGVPWYGYNYPCLNLTKNGTCLIEKIPFRGCNCSDAAGKEYPYNYMVEVQQFHHAKYEWDEMSLTPYYSFMDESTGQYRQMRYDDERSLPYKYMYAIFTGMRGVGMWTANSLDYSDTAAAQNQRDLMWGLLP